MRFDRRRPLTVAQQYLHLGANPVCAGAGRLHGNMLTWSMAITPTPLSRHYDVRVEYRQDTAPQVFVDDPDLTIIAGGRRLPHVYDQSPTRLCLYLPKSGEWASWMRLDQTVIPWAALWLLYFEEWLISGEWAGGGLHPGAGGRSPRQGARHRSRPTAPKEAAQ